MEFKVIIALLIMSILVIAFAIPTIISAITNSTIYGSIVGEIFNGISGTPYSSSYGNIKSVNSFQQSINTTDENLTKVIL
jgi:hypothetical protein